MSKWGMNVRVTGDFKKDSKFIEACKKAGIKAIRLSGILDGASSESDYYNLCKSYGLKIYPVLFDVVKLDEDPKQDEMWVRMKALYESHCFNIPSDICLGFALPQNIHLITRIGARSKENVSRETLKKRLNTLSGIIRKHGHKVIFPVRLDDIQGDCWAGVDFDVYDLETMLSAKVSRDLSSAAVEKTLKASGKEVWFGKAGILGGFVMPSQQAKFLRRVKDYAGGVAEYIYLWSEPKVDRYRWSVDGGFVVGLARQTVNPSYLNQLEGNPNLASYKEEKRRSKTIDKKPKRRFKQRKQKDAQLRTRNFGGVR